jgi:hypothetical protein
LISLFNTRNESRFLAHRAREEAPSREKSSANWRPRPCEAPEIRTCLVFNLFIELMSEQKDTLSERREDAAGTGKVNDLSF